MVTWVLLSLTSCDLNGEVTESDWNDRNGTKQVESFTVFLLFCVL